MTLTMNCLATGKMIEVGALPDRTLAKLELEKDRINVLL